MRTLTIEFLCVAIVTLAFAETVRGEDKDNIVILRSAPAKLIPMYKDHKGWEDSTLLKKAVLEADVKVRDAIKRLFEKSGNLKSIRTQTKDVIRWCEWPVNLSHSKKLEFRYGDGRFDRKLRINYRHCKAANGADFYLMQNSFWNKKGRGRVSPTMYTIVIAGGKVTMSLLPGEPAYLLGLEAPPCFLGFVHKGLSLPDIVVLNGPYGSGSFSTYCLYSHDTKGGGWMPKPFLKYSRAVEFSYDEKTNRLRYQSPEYSESSGKSIMRDRTYVICDNRSALRLKLSPIRGITYTKDKVLVVVTFENVDDKAITIRLDFTDQRQYLPGQLEIELRQNDGTLFSQRPKEGLVCHEDKPEYVTLKKNKPYSFKIDLAKLRRGLKDGEYTLSVQYNNQFDGRGFMGLVRSNTIDIRIGKQTLVPKK